MQDVSLRLAEKIRQLRIKGGLTQASLARQAGTTVETISRVERVIRGTKSADFNPTFDTLLRLSEALGVEVSELLEGKAQQLPRNDHLRRLLRRASPERVERVLRVAEALLAFDDGVESETHHPRSSSRH